MNSDFIFQYEPEIKSEDIRAITNYLQSGGFITEFKKTRLFEELLAISIHLNKLSILFTCYLRVIEFYDLAKNKQ